MFKPNDAESRRATMKPYEFANMPSSAAVSSLVTVLVSAWFVLASGAILTDQHSAANIERAKTPSEHAQVTPDAHFTITVEARRLAG
jgi:hypothetical protein